MDLLDDLQQARCADPFACLGLQDNSKTKGLSLTVWQPGALAIDILALEDDMLLGTMVSKDDNGLFYLDWPERKERFHYRLKIQYQDHELIRLDPYQFTDTTFNDVPHHSATMYLNQGANPAFCQISDELRIDGTRFCVYAPAARSISVVGDFNAWDGRAHPMASSGEGLWRLFIPDVGTGQKYKYEIRDKHGELTPHKTDPYARLIEQYPSFSSVTWDNGQYAWQDKPWMTQEKPDHYHKAMSIYEVHLGSWRRKHGQSLTFREHADELVNYVKEMAYTHVELLPVSEHPFDGSWGYQPVGLYAVTSRFGNPDDFKFLVDKFHQAGIGVIVDWVPAHFPADSHGLANFDGDKQYEYPDPKKGFHPEWKSLIYDFGKEHVVNYLISNAVYWLEEFHIDGLRVDAVASMLYLDYSREEGEWIPNVDGGNHNYEAINFLRRLNETIYLNHPRCFTVAEESTAFAGVSKPTYLDGLGFGFKWNMGWMNDSLQYISKDPIHRQHHHGEMTFSLAYAFDEQFVLPLSHDEVVHGKGSMLTKMPGDTWQQFANLRAFTAYMYFHPGKKLNFMGNELAQGREWNHDTSLDWHLLDIDYHQAQQSLCRDLNQLYQDEAALHYDHSYQGFEWISYDDKGNSILSFIRRAKDSDEKLVVLINFTPNPHNEYRVGVPDEGEYQLVFNTDGEPYKGSQYPVPTSCNTDAIASHGKDQSLCLQVPPLAAIALKLKA